MFNMKAEGPLSPSEFVAILNYLDGIDALVYYEEVVNLINRVKRHCDILRYTSQSDNIPTVENDPHGLGGGIDYREFYILTRKAYSAGVTSNVIFGKVARLAERVELWLAADSDDESSDLVSESHVGIVPDYAESAE